MKIIQANQGPKEANHSSTQNNTNIQTPDNGSYQQSLYIAAITQFIGCEGLASPATTKRDGIEYTFDFYHAQCGKVFKVLKNDDLSEYEKYVQYPGDVIVIVDVDGHPGCQIGKCPCCSDVYIFLPRDLGDRLHDTDTTYVYYQRHLWNYIGDEKDGTSQWIMVDPIVLQDSEDDED